MLHMFILVLGIMIAQTSYAGGLADALSKFASSSMYNVNKPGIVEDQLGGYMTGGSIHTRNKIDNLQMLSIQTPSLNAGCGGIDLFTGGFGYINHQNYQNLIKNIGSSALGYVVNMSLKTLSPQIADSLAQLEATARAINASNINSCQMGASIAAGSWPKTAASQELACQARQMGDNLASNFFTAKYNCSSGNLAEHNKQNYQSMLGSEYNLTWQAIMQAAPNTSQATAEMLMSLSGTVIARPTASGGISFKHYPSLIKEQQLLEQLLYGSNGNNLHLYHCLDDKCLELTTKAEYLPASRSYVNHITKLVNSMEDKLASEYAGSNITGLSADEKFLVQTSSIPILKFIKTSIAMRGSSVSLTASDYIEAVAFDHITSFFNELLEEASKALAQLAYGQNDDQLIKDFKQDIRYVQQLLHNDRNQAFAKLHNLLAIKQQIENSDMQAKINFAGSSRLKE